MIIDISSYNGKIDFAKMKANESIERIIMRASTKNMNLDTRLIENINGAIASGIKNIDLYKFSYARNYADACVECSILIEQLKAKGLMHFFDVLWLDLEPFDNREHTTDEVAQIICAYANICRLNGVYLGVYCNYSYLKNIVPKWAYNYDFWIARWTHGNLGDTFGANVVYWQYDNKGKCAGITGDVDISREVKT